MDSSPVTFDSAAERCLALWQLQERVRHGVFQEVICPQLVRRTVHCFRVARSLKGHGDKIGHHIELLRKYRELTPDDPITLVNALAAEYEGLFERRAVSAASKMLWTLHRSPFVIYDNYALTVLQDLVRLDRPDFRLRVGDYAEYYGTWLGCYRKYSDTVARAVADLTKTLLTAPARMRELDLDAGCLPALVDQNWFRERVFDIWLWLRAQQNNRVIASVARPNPPLGCLTCIRTGRFENCAATFAPERAKEETLKLV